MNNNMLKSLNIILIALLILGCGSGDCIRGEGELETRTLELGPIQRIEVQGAIDVRLSRQEQQQAEAQGQPNILDLLDTEVRDGVWTIRTRQCVRSRKDLIITLGVPTLSGISIQGSGDVSSEDEFETEELAVEILGSGDLKIEARASSLQATIAGSGDMTISGSCELFSSEIRGSGDIDAGGLKCVQAKADILGSGDIELHVTEALEANVTGSGNISYKGSPSKLTQNVTGSGSISSR